MATIKYKCDTCSREIELIENKNGITTFSNCTITQKCAGRLYSVGRNPNNLRESIPPYHVSLDDYSPRRLLYVHTQDNANVEWKVEHNLGLSCVFIVYGSNSEIIDEDAYTLKTYSSYATIQFPFPTAGVVHVISRVSSDESITTNDVGVEYTVVSANNLLTFALPKYITRIDSGAADPSITPTPTATALSSQPYSICSNTIQIEIEIQKPNQQPLTCTETLDALSSTSPWNGWNDIMVRNRKLYCVKSKNITSLKIFTNVNSNKIDIPDGTTFKILRIDYGTGLLTDIPDRGLLMLLSSAPFTALDKDVHHLTDCGELVGLRDTVFLFKNNELYINSKYIESTYPKITKL